MVIHNKSIKYVQKNISITEQDCQIIEDLSLNLSRFVQKKLRELKDGKK
jgi:Tfp pilus assembly ATPase PilU